MSIKTLQFCKPFYTMKSVKDELQYRISCKSIILNLGDDDIMVKNKPLKTLQSTVVVNLTIENISSIVVIEDYEKSNEIKSFQEIKKQWPLMYEITHMDRYKGIPVRRSPKGKIDNVEMNLFYVGAGTNIGLHQEHDYREVHTQLRGYGKMQQFSKKIFDELYQEEIMSPGFTHQPYCDEVGNYPWHQYQSISESVYLYVNQYAK